METKKIRAIKNLAIFEIIFLIMGVVALSYSLGSSFGIVSADDHACVQYFNSGETPRNVHVPEGSTANEYCDEIRSVGTAPTCNPAECPNDQTDSNPDGGPSLSDARRVAEAANRIFGPSSAPNPLSTDIFEGMKLGLGAESPTAPSIFSSEWVNPFTGRTPPSFQNLPTPEARPSVSLRGIIATNDIGWYQIGANAAVAVGLYIYADDLLEKTGLSPRWSRALGMAISKTYAVYGVIGPASELIFGKTLAIFGGPWLLIGVFLFSFFFSFFSETKYMVVTFSCNPWSPPSGGRNCDKCGDGKFGCSEYQCHSLGASCEFLSQEDGNICIWLNREDGEPPEIKPWEEILTLGYEYRSVSSRGVDIVSQTPDGCISGSSPIEFGVTLDESAKCKISSSREDSYESMNQYFHTGSTYRINHSQKMTLQSQSSPDFTLINGEVMDFFVRCEDLNGNSNIPDFSFSFCVDYTDFTAPEILGTSILDGSPIGFGVTSVELDLYVDEPAECKWSTLNRNYDDMENQMICSPSGASIPGFQQQYTCSTTLPGLRDGIDNNFYFRCRDHPEFAGTINESDRHTNTESFPFTLVGTRPLEILGLSPDNEIIKDSTDVIDVLLQAETAGGSNDGDSTCSYKGFATSGGFNEFLDTRSFRHSQPLSLLEGDYVYEVLCFDAGGNTDTGSLQFSVEKDNEAPNVVRVYREDFSLKVITNEEAECRYTDFGCSYSFEDASIMSSSFDGKEHFTSWNPDRNFFIKCRDEFLNEPDSDTCNIEVRPSE